MEGRNQGQEALSPRLSPPKNSGIIVSEGLLVGLFRQEHLFGRPYLRFDLIVFMISLIFHLAFLVGSCSYSIPSLSFVYLCSVGAGTHSALLIVY